MAKKLPSSVLISGVKWRIDRPRKIKEEGAACFGKCVPEDFTISVQAGLRIGRAWDTLLHEIAHAAWHMCGADKALETLDTSSDAARDDFEEGKIADAFRLSYQGALRELGLFTLPGD